MANIFTLKRPEKLLLSCFLCVCMFQVLEQNKLKLSTEQTNAQYQRFPPKTPHKVLCEAGIAAHASGTRLSGRAGVDPRSGSAFPPPCTWQLMRRIWAPDLAKKQLYSTRYYRCKKTLKSFPLGLKTPCNFKTVISLLFSYPKAAAVHSLCKKQHAWMNAFKLLQGWFFPKLFTFSCSCLKAAQILFKISAWSCFHSFWVIKVVFLCTLMKAGKKNYWTVQAAGFLVGWLTRGTHWAKGFLPVNFKKTKSRPISFWKCN